MCQTFITKSKYVPAITRQYSIYLFVEYYRFQLLHTSSCRILVKACPASYNQALTDHIYTNLSTCLSKSGIIIIDMPDNFVVFHFSETALLYNVPKHIDKRSFK